MLADPVVRRAPVRPLAVRHRRALHIAAIARVRSSAVLAVVLEFKARAGDQIRHGSRDEDLTGTCKRRNSLDDVNGYAGNVIAS